VVTVVIIALVVLALTGPLSVLLVTGMAESQPWSIAVDIVVSVLLAAAAGLSLVWPGLALAVAWAGAIVQMLAALPVLPADLAILMVVYATGAAASRRLRVTGVLSAVLGAIAAGVYLTAPGWFANPTDSTALTVGALLIFASLVTLALSWTLGVLVAAIRRGRSERAAAAAAQLETVAEQERGRIARDMHDVVAHSLGVIVAQADGARYLAETDPGRAGESLATISEVAREALSDVRLLLSRLRHQQGDLPQPRLADLDGLLEQFEAAGLRIEARRSPVPEGVPAGLQLAVFRIVQESLTNALRHGDRARSVRLAVTWAVREVTVEVVSALRPGTSPAEPGHGLTGMRERARLVGGTLTAESTGEAFVVRARLPREAPAALEEDGRHAVD